MRDTCGLVIKVWFVFYHVSVYHRRLFIHYWLTLDLLDLFIIFISLSQWKCWLHTHCVLFRWCWWLSLHKIVMTHSHRFYPVFCSICFNQCCVKILILYFCYEPLFLILKFHLKNDLNIFGIVKFYLWDSLQFLYVKE